MRSGSRSVQAFQQQIHALAARSVTLSPSQQLALLTELRTFGVNTVVVDPAVVPSGTRSLFTQIIGAPPVAKDGFLVWRFVPH